MLRKFFKRWVHRKDGTTAIEFSLLAIPYIMLSVGLIELSIMYAAASLLEGATGTAARLIRTGQVQQAISVDPEEMFRDAVCDYATVLMICDDIQIEVITMDSYMDFGDMGGNFDEDGNFVSSGFDPGGVNDKVLIRVVYTYEMMTPFVGMMLAGPDNSITFVSTIVLQTEPYEFQGET